MQIKFRDFEKLGNRKPAVDFDKKFHTTLSQQYKYPNNLTEKEVWYIIIHYLSNKKKGLYSFDKLMNILDKLDEHFPYADLKNLSNEDKFNILFGMISCFNSDDIIWFSIDHMVGTKNIEINNEVDKLPYHIRYNICWVLSPKTLKKLKTQLNILI